MQTTIQKIGEHSHIKMMYDPLKKEEVFNVLMSDNTIKNGYLLNDDVIFESNANIKFDNVKVIIGGFSNKNLYDKIITKINEETQ